MEVTRIFDILENYLKNFPKDDVFATKQNGVWKKISIQEYIETSNLFSLGLLAMGITKGDTIATVSNNRPEWNFADMGMAQIGAVHVPIYPSISMEEFSYILNHCEAKLLLVSGQELYEKLKPLTAQITSIRGFYTFDEIKEAKNWTEITKTGKQNSEKLSEKLQLIKDSINPDDLLTITYTSGTTGVSKGVMLSHKNFISNLQGLEGVHPYNKDQRVLSFLPLCHALERCANYLFQYHGTSIYYAESLAALPENLKEVKPHGFITVPHLLEKFYNRIIARGKDLPYILKIIFFWAVRLGFEFDFNKSIFYRIKLGIARKLIFTKWQQAFGGNIVTIICGGAALQTRLERLFWAAGIKVQNGYGLTEYSPVITGNHFDEAFVKFGTVGPGIKNVEIRIAEDGEILAKGPSIMLGYYKEPEITKTVIDDEGWLHTGDIGEIVDSIFLKVTDRKKEMFKLSTGKYVAPQVIENKLKESLFIERTVVIGDGKKFAAAVILPNFSFLHDWCSRKKIKYHDNSKLIKIPEVIARYQREVDFYNETLGHSEQIKKFSLVEDEWSIEKGDLSPTLKPKRKVIEEKYRSIIAEMYK